VQGKEPKPAELQELIQRATELGIKTILVQPQFSQKSAAIIADAINGGIVTADPMAEAWADNLRRLARQLQTIVR
jgi:zinc transport system substrate-binding protein